MHSSYRTSNGHGKQPGVMSFGRHKGDHVSELPDEYLTWLASEAEVKDRSLRQAIAEEAERRGLVANDSHAPGASVGSDRTANALERIAIALERLADRGMPASEAEIGGVS